MSVSRIVGLVAVFGVAVAAGVVLSATADEGATTRALPRTGAPMPVLDPVDGPVEDAAEPSQPDGGGSGTGGGAPDAGGAAGTDAGTEAREVPAVAEYDLEGGLPALRALDPCAVAGASGTCDGVAATVLGIFSARPLEILAVYGGSCAPPGAAERVPIGFPLTIYSSNPADFELTLTSRDDPTVVRTARTSTGAAAIEAWEAVDGRSAAITCAGVLLPNRTAEYDVSVTGTAGGETATYATVVLHEATGGRPPVQVVPPFIPDEDELRVVVPAQGPPRGGVAVRLFPNDGSIDSSCTSGGSTPRPVETTPVPATELDAPGYPYDLAWDHRYEHTFDAGDFSAGAPSVLCIFWYDAAGRVDERTAFPITPPNRYRVVLRVTEVDFTDHRGIPSEYAVSTLGGRCWVRLLGDEAVSRVAFEPAPGEDTREFTRMHGPPGSCHHESPLATMPGTAYTLPEFDPMLRVEVRRDGAGGVSAAYLRLPLSSCPASGGSCSVGSGPTHSFDRSYEVALPERAGTVTIRASFSETDRAGGRFWEIGAPVPFS